MISQVHINEIAATLLQYRHDEFLCDTILNANGHELKAHSIILAAVSPVFKSAFKANGKLGMHYINLPDLDQTVVEIALHFMYTGNLLLPSNYTCSDKLPKLFDA